MAQLGHRKHSKSSSRADHTVQPFHHQERKPLFYISSKQRIQSTVLGLNTFSPTPTKFLLGHIQEGLSWADHFILCVSPVDPDQTTILQSSSSPALRMEPCISSLEKPLFVMAITPSWQDVEVPSGLLKWHNGRPVFAAKLPPHPGTS